MSKQTFYSVRQAAGLLGCTIKYVRDLLYEGRLNAEKLGRTWQIDSKSLEAFRQKRGQQ
jgi:excisionase family DNA binding protein